MQLRIGARYNAAPLVGEGGFLSAIGEIGAHLAELRIGAEGVETGDGQIELAAKRAQEFVAGAALDINRRNVRGHDLLQIAVERVHVAFDSANAAFNEFRSEREALGIFFAHFAAWAIARLGIGARGATGALKLGLFGRDLRQLNKGCLQLLKAR